jgi:hypothetical protein
MQNDQMFENPYMNQYFTSLDENSGSVFFEVFNQVGAKATANSSKLFSTGDLVELSLDRLYRLSDVSDAQGINEDRAEFGRPPVDVALIERLLSELVAPLGLGRIHEAYTSLVDQDLSREQEKQFIQLFAPVVCEALGELAKENGVDFLNNNSSRLAFYERVFSLFQAGYSRA